jgi:hypothetical protein
MKFEEFLARVNRTRVTVFERPAVICEGWRAAFLVGVVK